MNRTLRVRLNARSIVLKQSVSFVARYPDIAAPIERIRIEAEFYQAVAGLPEVARFMPGVLGFDPTNHLLCLEDLGPSRDFTNLYDQTHDAADLEQLTNLVKWLSNLHAIPDLDERFPHGLDNHGMRELNHTHIFEIPLTPDNGVTLDSGLDSVAEQFAGDGALRKRATQLGRIYLGYLGHIGYLAGEPHNAPKVLLHGDYYPGSWLKHPSTGVKVIDPEFAFLGPPEFDVGVLLAHLTMCRYEQSELTTLLGNYMAPTGFSYPLVKAFSGMEVIRRLLGVAQLPLPANAETRVDWLHAARAMVLG